MRCEGRVEYRFDYGAAHASKFNRNTCSARCFQLNQPFPAISTSLQFTAKHGGSDCYNLAYCLRFAGAHIRPQEKNQRRSPKTTPGQLHEAWLTRKPAVGQLRRARLCTQLSQRSSPPIPAPQASSIAQQPAGCPQ